MGLSKQGIKRLLMLLAALSLLGCGEAAEEGVPAPAPVVTVSPTAEPAPSGDDWLKAARDAMELGDYDAALAALDRLSEKSEAAERLRSECCFQLGEKALDAGDFAAAIDFYQGAEAAPDAEGRLKLAEAMLRGDYMAAAQAAVETRPSPYRPWQDFIRVHMEPPQTLEEVFQQDLVFRVLNHVDEREPINETWIESIDRSETNVHNVGYIGPIASYDPKENLLVLGEGTPELAVCGQGGGKALVVRRQPDYPRGSVHAAVDKWMSLLPAGLYPASLDEVDYVIYLDYDYSVCASVSGLDALQMNCVVRLVNENTGEELYRSDKILGDTDYNDPYRLEHLAEEDWVVCGNPPIGRALAEAIAAIPRG